MNSFRWTRLCVMVLVSMSCSGVRAQMSDANYKLYAEEVRKEVWGWSQPAFKNRVIPPEFANASSIVLAHHTDISANSKLKVTVLLSATRSFKFTHTVRELVKINDKTSLNEYSEFSFQKLSKQTGAYGMTRRTVVVVVGVRVIKPDGKVIDVDTNEAVSMVQSDGKSKKDKLAISDLQVGDMIDYFVQTEEKEDMATMEPVFFVLGDNNPILSYSVHCDISDKYAVEYRALNGAPDFKVVRGPEKEFIMDFEKKNIAAVPTGLWMSVVRQIPIIRLNLITQMMFRTGRKPGVLYKNPPSTDFLEEAKTSLSSDNYALYYRRAPIPNSSEVRDLADQYEKARKGKKILQDSLARYIYYAYRHYLYGGINRDEVAAGIERNYQRSTQMAYIEKLLEKYDIRSDYVFVTSRFGPDMKQITSKYDLETILRVRSEHPFFITAEGVFEVPGNIDPDYEGQDAPAILYKDAKPVPAGESRIKVPASTASDNRLSSTLAISWNDKNPLELGVIRKVSITGHQKLGVQRRLLLFEQYDAEERRFLKMKQSLMDEITAARRTRNMKTEYEAAFEKASKDQIDYFKEEINSEFDQQPANLKNCTIVNSGIFDTNPAFVFSAEFTIEGWVKKAGNNYIVDVGKFIGTQLQLKEEQRKRSVDIYMPYARSYEYDITFQIPAGYKVEGIENLSKTMENQTGQFTATASVEADKIHIHVLKTYKTNFEPAANWPLLMQFIDFGSDWTSQKILLRKG